jgi:poly(3-hydroxybutyrate) depolymerase
MLYLAYEAQRAALLPARLLAGATKAALGTLPEGAAGRRPVKKIAAACELMMRAELTHTRPAYGIKSVQIGGSEYDVVEEVTHQTPFGALVHFRKIGAPAGPRVVIVAALAGHFATLLRDTAETLLPDHDVYITDWFNARDVPLQEGRFGLDDYIAHVIDYLELLGPGTHLLGVCQPCPAALAATAILAKRGSDSVPRSLTLMAGPVDTRNNPTKVNDLATSTPLRWFEDNVVFTVPLGHKGAGRRVYPGFVQLTAFASMNIKRHIQQHIALFRSRSAGEDDVAKVITDFYDEYFAVLDLHADYYLETVDKVFMRHLLPKGELTWRGELVDPSVITRTALMTVEGERDDICGLGQTMAAHELCSNVPARRHEHHLQLGVGHYGVFSGSRWRQETYPMVRNFIQRNE